MPTILESIHEYEPDLLLMIAEMWGADLNVDQRKDVSKQVAQILSSPEDARDMLNALNTAEREALALLASNRGRLVWDRFARQYGELREMGAAKREKERPHRNPRTVSESLFYKGLIGRAFFESGRGIREYAFLPDELQSMLAVPLPKSVPTLLPAKQKSSITALPQAHDRLLDHACTLLSQLRCGLTVGQNDIQNPNIPIVFLSAILTELGLLQDNRVIHPERVKAFLETPRHESFTGLVQTWVESENLNEINLLSDLECEGGWKNRARENRADMLAWVGALQADNWYTLEDFVTWVRKNDPDFMRSAGEYDAWIIRHVPSGEYLRGLSHWDQVEGAYLRLMLTSPLLWMGLLELGSSPKIDGRVFFRKSEWARTFFSYEKMEKHVPASPPLLLYKNGKITLERLFPLHGRYLISRFCEFQGEKHGRYFFSLTPAALRRAEEQGLKIPQLISLLRKYGKKPLPANILDALNTWSKTRQQAELQPGVILRVPSAAHMQKIMDSAHKKFIIEQLNPTTAMITRPSIPYLRSFLLEMGVFTDSLPEN